MHNFGGPGKVFPVAPAVLGAFSSGAAAATSGREENWKERQKKSRDWERQGGADTVGK